MLRVIFALFVLLHGLIHLLGFLKEFRLARVEQLTGQTLVPLSSRAAHLAGTLWLVAAVLLVAAAAAVAVRRDWWWTLALAGIVLSQALIILYWKDAFAGTVANVVILPVALVAFGVWNLANRAAADVVSMLEQPGRVSASPLTPDMAAHLPAPVVHWLERSGAVGRVPVRRLRLKQRGEMRSKPGGNWMPFEAEQHITVDPPGFVWTARVEVAPLVHIGALDRYAAGRGRMIIKAFSLVPIADASGSEIDQGTLVRYLAETAWYPTAALGPHLAWEAIDARSARATMSHGGVSGSGVFRFDEQGDMVGFEAQRYGEFDGRFRMETWSIATTGQRVFGGLRIPAVSQVTWKLASGDYTWLRLEILDVEYRGADRP